jgi:tRNA1Val (adenine37-N6)-methyltransferase
MATLSGGALGDGAPLEATQDALFGGSVVLFQPQRGAGYRTNVDALLLAGFAATAGSSAPHASALARTGPRTTPRAAPVVFDLGAGVGAVGLALLRFGAAKRVVFVEIDEQPAAMARRNLDANGWTERGEVVRGDVRDVALSRRGEATLVVCNPPYIAPGRGRARAAEVAGRRARTCFVYPAHELTLLIATLAAEGLHAKRMRFVHGTPEAPARVVLVEAQAARAGGLSVIPPLVERVARGYTPEMAALLARG